jgi:ankyrin repeat protein
MDRRDHLHYAARYGSLAIARGLLDQGHDVNERNYFEETPLHDAARFNRVDMVQLLLDRGADLEAPNRSGNTPLQICRNFNMFELLLSRGADAMTTKNNGMQILNSILIRDHGPIWMSFLFHHIDGDPSTFLSEKDSKGRTPLLSREIQSEETT